MVDRLLSVIIRFHDPRLLAQLDEALFSLATQRYLQIQIILAVQNSQPELTQKLTALILKQPFAKPEVDPSGTLPFKVLDVTIPQGIDGRSTLLNEGISAADGQYLAFLDYDDVVYPESYSLLIQNCQNSGSAVAVGGCRLATQRWTTVQPAHLFTGSKRPYLDHAKNKLDLFLDNFIPIHSFVIDRAQIDPELLRFDVTLRCFEDYEVLLKLAAKYEFDFTDLSTPIVEYRIRNDGSNTIPTHESDPQKLQEWTEAKTKMNQLKQSLQVTMRASDLQALIQERDQLLAERKSLSFRIASVFFYLGRRFPSVRRSIVGPLKFFATRVWAAKRWVMRIFRFND
jgi:glycosyltransferase involved in cell wall biosynthesis